MIIRARVHHEAGQHRVVLSTNDATHTLPIPPKPEGRGSGTNGGELLFLALATCFCNDVYREAAREGIDVRSVEVEVEGACTRSRRACSASKSRLPLPRTTG